MLKKQILIALREHVHTVSIPVNPALYREKWGLQGYTLAVLFMILTLIFVANQNRLIEAVLTTTEKKYIYCAKIRKISHFYLKKPKFSNGQCFLSYSHCTKCNRTNLETPPRVACWKWEKPMKLKDMMPVDLGGLKGWRIWCFMLRRIWCHFLTSAGRMRIWPDFQKSWYFLFHGTRRILIDTECFGGFALVLKCVTVSYEVIVCSKSRFKASFSMLRNVPSRICIKSFTEVISLSNQLDAEIQTFGYSSFRHLVESLTYLLISLLLSILCGFWGVGFIFRSTRKRCWSRRICTTRIKRGRKRNDHTPWLSKFKSRYAPVHTYSTPDVAPRLFRCNFINLSLSTYYEDEQIK